MPKKKENTNDYLVEILQSRPGQLFTARQLAEELFERYPTELTRRQKKETSPRALEDWVVVLQQGISGARRRQILRKDASISTTEGRPRQFYWAAPREQSDEEDRPSSSEDDSPSADRDPTKREHDLYPILMEFVLTELNVYSKRIDETRSKKPGGLGRNKWLHPDVVGIEPLGTEWHPNIRQCVAQFADPRARLWAFEVKTEINRANVREAFFQAVSNSTWAHFGYLVASEIIGEEALNEVKMLSSLYGIGFVLLNTGNPAESEVRFLSRERPRVDWGVANRLVAINPDFAEFIKHVTQFHQTGEVKEQDWYQSSTSE